MGSTNGRIEKLEDQVELREKRGDPIVPAETEYVRPVLADEDVPLALAALYERSIDYLNRGWLKMASSTRYPNGWSAGPVPGTYTVLACGGERPGHVDKPVYHVACCLDFYLKAYVEHTGALTPESAEELMRWTADTLGAEVARLREDGLVDQVADHESLLEKLYYRIVP